MKQVLNSFLLIVLTNILCSSQIIKVPQNYSNIQTAINAADDGDTIIVAEGTYYESINYLGKKITIASQFLIDGDIAHRDKTIIDGSRSGKPGNGSVVYFMSGEDTNSVLYGLTITGGTGTNSPPDKRKWPKFINNTVVDNFAKDVGGGIYTYSQEILLTNCIIWGNKALTNFQVYGNILIEYSDVEGGYSGIGNIDENPYFVDTVFYQLKSISPCIDAGKPGSTFNDPEDPNKSGYALIPALGMLRNDMGVFGGSEFKHLRNFENDR